MDTDDGPGGTTWDDLDNVGANLEAMLQEQDVSGGLDESPVPTPGPQRSYPPPQPAGQPLPREDIVLPSPPPPALSVDPGQTSDSLSELEEQAKKAIEDADGDNLLSPTKPHSAMAASAPAPKPPAAPQDPARQAAEEQAVLAVVRGEASGWDNPQMSMDLGDLDAAARELMRDLEAARQESQRAQEHRPASETGGEDPPAAATSGVGEAIVGVYRRLWEGTPGPSLTRQDLLEALREDEAVLAHGGAKGFLAELVNEFERSGTDDSTVTFEQFCFAFGIDSSQFVLPSKGGALEEVRPPAAAAPEEIGDALGGGGPVPMATDMPAWDRGITDDRPQSQDRQSMASDETVAHPDEKRLLLSMSEEVLSSCGGSAKLVVLSGIGAQQSRRSVLRRWPKYWEMFNNRAAESASQSKYQQSEKDYFQANLGGEYSLGDMHLLDVGSMHWSQPITQGDMGHPRSSAAACVIPMRFVTEPPEDYIRRPGEQPTDAFLQRSSCHFTALFGSVVDLFEGPEPVENENGILEAPPSSVFVGKLQLDALMSAWHQATKADFPDGKVPESDMTDFLNSLFGPTLAAEEKAEKLKLPRDVVHRLMNQMGAGKMVEGIPEPVHDLDDLNHAMMSVVGVVESLPEVLQAASSKPMSSPDDVVISVSAVQLYPDHSGETGEATSWAQPLSPEISLMWVQIVLDQCGQTMANSAAVSRKEFSKDQADQADIRGLACVGRATMAPRNDKQVAIREHLVRMLAGMVQPADLIVQLKGQLSSPRCKLFDLPIQQETVGEETAGDETAGETDMDDATSVAGMSVAGRSVAGQSVAGQSVAGQSVAGHSVAPSAMSRKSRKGKGKGKGKTANAKKPVGVLAEARFSLDGFLSGQQQDFENKWVDLISCAGAAEFRGVPIGLVQVSLSAAQVLRSMQREVKRAYMDSFRVLLFGGCVALPVEDSCGGKSWRQQASDELRMFDASANRWEILPPPAAPGAAPQPNPRWGATFVRWGRCAYLFGGFDGSKALGDLHVLNTNTLEWESHKPGGGPPSARQGHAAVVAETPNSSQHIAHMVIFGGQADGGLLLGDVAAMSMGASGPGKWLKTSLEQSSDGNPLPRSGASAAVVTAGNTWSCYVFGGKVDPKSSQAQADPFFRRGGGGMMNDLWVLKPVPNKAHNVQGEPDEPLKLVWSRVETIGRPPARREGARMAAVGRKLLVTGGWVGGKPTQGSPWARDLWLLDTVTDTWTSLSFYGHSPSGRFAHAAVVADFRASVGEMATIRAALGSEDTWNAMKDSKGREHTVVTAEAGRTVRLVIEARDAVGLRADRGGDLFRVTLDPAGSQDIRLPSFYPAIHDNGDTTYSVSVTATTAGNYHLMVRSQEGLPVLGCPLLVLITPATGVASRTSCEGGGIVKALMGEVAYFHIVKRDVFGNMVAPLFDEDGSWSREKDDVGVSVVGPNGDPVAVKMMPDGDLYRAGWAPTLSGRYTISVRVKHMHVPNSPFKVAVAPGPTYIPLCKLKGTVVDLGRWHAGALAKIRIRAMDAFSNQRVKGGDKWTLKFERVEIDELDGSTVATGQEFGVENPEVIDNRDGTYTITFTPYESGICALSVISMNAASLGQHVEGSPVHFEIKYGALDPECCETVGKGITGETINGVEHAIEAGEDQTITFFAFDLYRNRIGTGGDFVECFLTHVKSGKRFRISMEDLEDGSYRGKYHTTLVGEYTISLTAGSTAYGSNETKPKMRHVAGSPWRIFSLDGPPCPAQTTASGPGVSGECAALEPMVLRVDVRDKYGNKCTRFDSTKHQLEVSINAGWDLPIKMRDHGDGTYTIVYTAGDEEEFTGSTVYKIDIRLDNHPILLSPFMQRVSPAATDPSKCYAQYVPKMLTVGETGEFLVQAVDINGSKKKRGLDNFAMDITGNETLYGDIKDLRNGAYLVRFRGEELAYYKATISVKLFGQHIQGSPFSCKVVPAGLFNVGLFGGFKVVDEEVAKAFVMSGSGTEHAMAGERVELDIISKRLNEDTPGEDFSLELRGPEFVEGVVEGPLTSAAYKARFVATKAGEYIGILKLGRQPLPGSPFHVFVRPDATHPDHCVAEGIGLEECTVFEESKITVKTYDIHGNRTAQKFDMMQILVKGGGLQGKGKKMKFRKAVVGGTVRSNQAGTFEITYAVPYAGAYSIEVTYGTNPDGPWAPIRDSPFQMIAIPPPEHPEAKKRQNKARSMGAAEAVASLVATAGLQSKTIRPEEIQRQRAAAEREKEEATLKLLPPAPMPGTTLYQSIPTEAVERHEKLIVQKLSEMAAKNMTVGGQDGSIFKFGFWGQGAMMRRAELIEEESDEVPIDSAEAISNGGLPWGEGEGPNKGWLGSNMGTLRSKQIGMLHLINKAAFEAGSGGTDKGDGPPAQLALPAP